MRSIRMDTNDDLDRDMQIRDKTTRVIRRSHRYGHSDYSNHTGRRRHRKHKRQVQEEDHSEIGRQGRPGLEELLDESPLPLQLPSSTDLDITSRLPRDAVFCILDKLLEPIDHLRFAIVSKEWNAAAKDYNHTTQRWSKLLQQQQVPMLMIPTGTEGEQKMYSVTERRIYDHIRLPIPYNKKTCCGSNYGWLAIIDKSLEEFASPDRSPFEDVVVITFRITLQNPFRTGIEAIHLPPLKFRISKSEQQYTYIILHVILSADPTSHPENYAVLAFCNLHLPFSFIRAGRQQKTWVQFRSLHFGYNISMYASAVYRNQICAIHDWGALMMKADVGTSSSTDPIPVHRLFLANRTTAGFTNDESYLVESTTGDLLCVARRSPVPEIDHCGEWLPFRVYKIVFTENSKDGDEFRRIEIDNIGDEAIFLDYSLSKCVSASKFPGCQPNSIYYYTTNDSGKLYRGRLNLPKTTRKLCEMGVYNLGTKVTTTLYSSQDQNEGCLNNIYRPHWVLPCFKL